MKWLEKVALAAASVAASFNVFLFTVGATLADATATNVWLYWPRITVGVFSAVAFDLVIVTTVLGARLGHRNRWSYVTAVAAALVSFAIGLDVAGVWPQPWLHAVYSFIVLAFMLHLTADSQMQPAAQPGVSLTVQNVAAVQVATQPEAQPLQLPQPEAQPVGLPDPLPLARPPEPLVAAEAQATSAQPAAQPRPVTIDGATYSSRRAAATALGITPQAVSKRAKKEQTA